MAFEYPHSTAPGFLQREQSKRSTWLGWVVLTQGLSWRCKKVHVFWACIQLKCWLELKNPLPKWLIHVAGKLVLAIGKRPQFLSSGVLEYPHNVVPGFLQREQFERSKQKQQRLHDLALDVTYHQFSHISSAHIGQPWFYVGMDCGRAWISEGKMIGSHLGSWLPHPSKMNIANWYVPNLQG